MEIKLKFQILFLLSFIISFEIIKCHHIDDELEAKCSKKVHEECPDDYQPTQRELDRARRYIQKIILEKAKYKPDITKLKPCKKLYARRNFKCIPHEERLRLIETFKEVYKSGLMWQLADIHGRCWPAWHKSGEGFLGHKVILTKLEHAMIKIDSRVIIPYWNVAEDCVNPERSLIWKYFGTCGSRDTNWCVKDGPFTEETKANCIKRQWRSDRTIPPWYCPDISEMHLTPASYVIFYGFTFGNLHFRPHINIGGNNSYYSQPWAPYDAIFPLHHFHTDCTLIQLQLSYVPLLTPGLLYDQAFAFDQTTHKTRQANLKKDTLCHYNTSVLDWFYIGFGEQCVVCDFIVKAINKKLDNHGNREPSALNDVLNHTQPEREIWEQLVPFNPSPRNLSGCNPKCRPMPFPQRFSDTPEGQRQINLFKYAWDVNTYPPFFLVGMFLRGLVKLLNLIGYCSPYVTSKDHRDTIDSQFENYNLNDLPSIKRYLSNILILFKISIISLLKKLNLQYI